METHELTLIDDNIMNIECATKLGIQGIQIRHNKSLHTALLQFLGVYDAGDSFDDAKYLQAKNEVDRCSKSKLTRSALKDKLQHRLDASTEDSLVIVDLGAGKLFNTMSSKRRTYFYRVTGPTGGFSDLSV